MSVFQHWKALNFSNNFDSNYDPLFLTGKDLLFQITEQENNISLEKLSASHSQGQQHKNYKVHVISI